MPIENSPGGMRPQPPALQDPPAAGGVVNGMRPQPPTLMAPRAGSAPQWELGQEGEDRPLEPEEDDEDEGHPRTDQPDWEKRAKDAMRFSTNYLDSNFRQQWEDSLRAFNNQHPAGSKYTSEAFRKRSNLFVPVTRTVIRKNEAAACKAFFSNQDLISIQAMNEGDPKQVLSASLMKELLQYRLTHTVPWFKLIIGGIQDAQAQGACIYHPRWEYRTRQNARGETVVAVDRPWVDLVPLENLRIDPAANWLDPINTSPYVIQLVDMFLGDVKQKMSEPNPKGQQWTEYSDEEIKSTSPDDSTRSARLNLAQDPTQETREVSDYDVVWVQRHIHRWDGTDWLFWTLNNGKLLTTPEPLEKTVFHGQRDYILGVAMVETHKVLPTTVPALVKPLQDGINAIENQRNDNVMLVLNKRWKVKRGSNVDTASLMRNVAGGVSMVDNMEDLEEIQWNDVTASSFQEADRKRQAFDELVGNFNPMQMHQAGAPREAQGTVRMLQGPANEMTEFLLQTFAITGVVPLLRQLVLLEQHYETDATILAVAGQKAQALQKFGVDKVTDDMLDHELTTTCNVGMGSTDPVAKINRFVYCISSFAQVCRQPPPGVNLAEVWKELCALSGYQDGERFSTQGNPALVKAEQMIKALTMKVQDLMRHKQDKDGANVVKLVTAREKNASTEKVALIKHGGAHQLLYAQHLLDQDDMLLAKALGATQLPGEQPPAAAGGQAGPKAA